MKKKILILSILLVLLSGCTKRFTVTNEETSKKKNYTANILCKPTTEELKDIYTEYKDEKSVSDIEKLPDCKNFNAFKSKYESLWTSVFIKPLAMLIIKIGNLVNNYGISIMLVGLALRIIMFPLSKKSTSMSENMKLAQKDLEKLEKKYRNKIDKESMMMKSKEQWIIYKKYNISPISSCLFALIQLPLFFAFLEAINRIPVFFEQNLWKFHLGLTPMEGFATGNYYYIIIVVLISLATYFSFKNMNTTSMDEMQAKSMAVMNKFMVGFISIASLYLPTAIGLYWIVSNGFTVVQNFIMKRGKKSYGKV